MSNAQGTCTILIYDNQVINMMALFKFFSPCFKIIAAANLREVELIIRQRKVPLTILSVEDEDNEEIKNLVNATEDNTYFIFLVTSKKNTPELPNSVCLSKPVDFLELLHAMQTLLPCMSNNSPCNCSHCFERMKKNLLSFSNTR